MTAPNVLQRRRWLTRRLATSDGQRRWRRGCFEAPEGGTTPAGRRWSSRQLHRLGEITAHAWAGVTVTVVAVGWVAYGAVAGFTAQWQAILTSTAAIVTVVMVFAIQHTQSREQAALQRKLDELVRALPGADNRLISVEAAPDGELQALTERDLADRER
jgi:low affinity Fe/Cu permease